MEIGHFMWKKYFTLVEILAVIVIMGIIMAIALPSFIKISKGHATEESAKLIASSLKYVRSYAITNREYTALIFPENSEGLSEEYTYKSYRSCIISVNGTTYTFSRWIPDSEWHFLPKGASVDSIVNEDIIRSVVFTNAGGSSSADSRGIAFKRTGEALGSEKEVIITEKIYSEGEYKAVNDANKVYVTVDQYTGRISYGQD